MKTIQLFLIFLIINFSKNYSQTYLSYRFTLINENFESRLIEILEDTLNLENIKVEAYNNIINSNNNSQDTNNLFSMKNYWFIIKDQLPLVYNDDTTFCFKEYIKYDSIYLTDKKLFLQKNINSQINISLENFLFGEVPPIYVQSIIKNGDLLINNGDQLEPVFSIRESKIKSFLGESYYLRNYDSIKFFNRIFKNINEFYFKTKNEEYEFLIWFDQKYKLIRIEGFEYGYILINNMD